MRALEYDSVSQSEALHDHETKGVKVSPMRFKAFFLVSLVLLLTAFVVVYSMPWYKSSQEDPGSSSDGANQTLVLSKSAEEEPASAFPPAGDDAGVEVLAKNTTVDEYNCQGERFANETPLRTGQFLCSNNKQFVFGMTLEGSLIKRSTASDATYKKDDTFYDKGGGGDYFVLHRDGKIAVYDMKDEVQWQRESRATIHWTSKCLKDYDCPYLHLHDDGVLVLNWIANGRWNAKGIKEVYDFSKA